MDEKTLLFFKAPWCIPCKNMDPIVNNVLNYFDNIKLVVINIDENADLVEEYKIRTIPTLILKDGSKVIRKISGFANLTQLKEFLSL